MVNATVTVVWAVRQLVEGGEWRVLPVTPEQAAQWEARGEGLVFTARARAEAVAKRLRDGETTLPPPRVDDSTMIHPCDREITVEWAYDLDTAHVGLHGFSDDLHADSYDIGVTACRLAPYDVEAYLRAVVVAAKLQRIIAAASR